MLRLEDIFAPEWDLLLVEREKKGDVVGIGLGGQAIVTPDAGKSMVGKILRVGPDVPSWYIVGRRVVFGVHSGTRIEMPGQRSRDVLILPRSEILTMMDGEEGGDQLLDLSWKDHVLAPPGKLLVERMETPIARGRIIIPDGVSTARRSSEGRVHRVGRIPRWRTERQRLPWWRWQVRLSWPFLVTEQVIGAEVFDPSRFEEGDQVFIAGNVSRSFPLGYREEERLYVCEPGQLSGHILADLGEDGLRAESSAMRGAETIPDEEVEQCFDEGDSRVPQ